MSAREVLEGADPQAMPPGGLGHLQPQPGPCGDLSFRRLVQTPGAWVLEQTGGRKVSFLNCPEPQGPHLQTGTQLSPANNRLTF